MHWIHCRKCLRVVRVNNKASENRLIHAVLKEVDNDAKLPVHVTVINCIMNGRGKLRVCYG